MYITMLVMPVPEENIEAYKAWAELSANIFKDYGCTEVVDGWEDFVPKGENTDFFRAVNAMEGEKIAFSWQIWPDKETLFAAEEKMHADGVLDAHGAPPYDNKRLIAGCFDSIFAMGRSDSA